MASGQIRMTPELMRQRAQAYRAESEQVREVILRMDTLLTELKNEWEGASMTAYEQAFSELRPSFTAAEQLILEISGALMNSAELLEETDRRIAGQFQI